MTAVIRRLRVGELLAAPAGLLLGSSLFLPWYSFASGRLDAWSAFNVIDVLIAPAALAAFALSWVTLTRATPALPVALAVWTTLLGVVASLCVVLRLLIPPHGAFSTCAGVFVGLAGALAVTAAGWLSVNDERPARGVHVKGGRA